MSLALYNYPPIARTAAMSNYPVPQQSDLLTMIFVSRIPEKIEDDDIIEIMEVLSV